MQHFDADATRDALPFGALVEALRELFVQGCEVPPRHFHTLPCVDGDGTLLIMPAWLPGRFLGIKTVSFFPGNAARGLPGLHSTYTLYDAATGRPLAQMDGDQITSRRTAATSALAASMLARPDAKRLLVVGAGRIAALLPAAFRAVRPIDQVSVWARRPAQAEVLAAEWRRDGFDADVATDLAAAASAADVVSCATLADAPLVRGERLRPGSHLDLIGGFTPQMREADAACFAGAVVCVDTEEALLKSGDLLQPMASGVLQAADVGTLTALCRGQHAGRRAHAERTVFKSVGYALEDLAAAMRIWQTR